MQEARTHYGQCPLLKSKPTRLKCKKAMRVTWVKLGGSEYEEESDNKDAMVCFVAIAETDHEGSDTEVNVHLFLKE